ncbi:MAG: aldo/keto reductase [Brevinema sp.]
MKYTYIKDTDLRISSIILGTVNAGLDWDGKEGYEIFDKYIATGGNIVDIASVYSNWVKPEINRAERFVGDWLRNTATKREDIIIMTKGGHPELDTMHIGRMSKEEMTKDLNNSLQKLGIDCIDIYFYHRDDISKPVSEHIELMEEFRKQGKIRYYACSNWTTKRMIEADKYCKQKGYRSFVANQALYNIGSAYMNPFPDKTMVTVDNTMLEYHAKGSNLLMPYMALSSGFFHLLKEGKDISTSLYNTPQNLTLAQRIDHLCKKYNATISQILLGFVLNQKFDMCPLFSANNMDQLNDILHVVNIQFDREDFQ